MDHRGLKARQRRERATYPEGLGLRVHRALSWLDAAERSDGDWDARFIFLWIAFNAAYAQEVRAGGSEQTTFLDFVRRLVGLDSKGQLAALVWQSYGTSIRTLIDNPYVHGGFWAWQAGQISEARWKERFEGARRVALKALAREDTALVLSIALSRIYVLRNQLLHGGSTWNSSVNRAQVRDCAKLMGKLVPVIIEILMNHPEAEWPDVVYPVIKDPLEVG